MKEQLDRIEEKLDNLIAKGAKNSTDIGWLKAGFKTMIMAILGVVGYIVQTFIKQG